MLTVENTESDRFSLPDDLLDVEYTSDDGDDLFDHETDFDDDIPTVKILKSYLLTAKDMTGNIFDAEITASGMAAAEKATLSMFGSTIEVLFVDVRAL